MSLKYKIIALAIVPLLGATLTLAYLVVRHAHRLGDEQARLIEGSLMQQKRDELRHSVALLRSQVEAVSLAEPDDEAAKRRIKTLIATAHYGADGYFFANDLAGVCLVHPRQPELVGKNLWDLKDARGRYVIRGLLESAQHGDGFFPYMWEKPSTGQPADKLAHVTVLPRFGWVLGTGVYLDDVGRATQSVRDQARASVTQTMWQLAIAVSLAIAAVFAGTMALNVSAQRLADGKLRALNSELTELGDRLDCVRENERARVSSSLHDGISQLLAGTKYHFELARQELEHADGQALASLDAGLTRLGQCIADVRRISHELHPRELDELGLPAALRRLGDDVARRSGINVMVHAEIDGVSLPDRRSLTLFRVAQEAMTNVERHAAARQVELELRRDERQETVVLRVVDDGRGFDTGIMSDQTLDGIGLRSIRQRVAELRGIFDVRSRPGRTELSVSLNVSPPA